MRSLLLKNAKSLRCISKGGGDNGDQSISETSNSSSLGVVVWDSGLGSTACKKKQDDASKNTKKKSNKNIKQKGESSSRKLGTSLAVDADDRNNNNIIRAGEFRKVQGLTSLEGQIVKILRQVNNNDKRIKYKKWHVKVQTSGKIIEISGKFLVKFCEINNNNENTTMNVIKPKEQQQQQQQQDSTEKSEKKFNNKTKTPSGGDKKAIPRRGLDCTEKSQKKSNNNNKKKPADSKPETKMKDPVHPTQPKARTPPPVGLCQQMSTPNRLGPEKAVQVSDQKSSSGISPSNKLEKKPSFCFNIQEWDSDSDSDDSDSDGSMDYKGLFRQKESDSDNDDESIDQRMVFQTSCPDLRLCEKDAADANDAISSKNKKTFAEPPKRPAQRAKSGTPPLDQSQGSTESNKKAPLKRNKSLESSGKQKKKGKETNRKKPQLNRSKSSQLQKKKKDARQSSSSSPSSSQMQRLYQSSPAFNFDVNDDTKESADNNNNNDPPTSHQKSNELFKATDHLIQRVISRNKSLKQRRKSNESSETKIEAEKKEVLDKTLLLEATQKEMAALERTIRKSNGVRKMLKRSKSAVVLSPTMKSRSKVTGCTTKNHKDQHQVVEQDVPKRVESVSIVPSSLNDSCISLGIEDVGGRRKGLQRSRSAVLPRDVALCEEEEGGKEEDQRRNVERTISSRNSSSSPPTTATAAPPRILARTSSREAMMRRNRTRSLRDILRQDEDSCNSSQNDLDHSWNNNSVFEASDEDSTPKRALKKSNSLSNLGRKAFRRSRSCSNLGRTRSSKDNVRLDKVQKKSLKGKEERGSRLATLKLKEHKKNQPVLKKIAAMPLQPFRNNNNTTAVNSNDDAGPQRRGVTRGLSVGNKLRMQ